MNHSLHESQTKLLSVGQHSKSFPIPIEMTGFLITKFD